MKRLLIHLTLLVGALALATAGLADPGGKGKGKKNGHDKKDKRDDEGDGD